ncbi:hypothetical protein EGI32_04565 [Ferruginibacter sp. HRS2-29]|nr:hypothetical protein [Ferruginibacter sp. HRS2-29]
MERDATQIIMIAYDFHRKSYAATHIIMMIVIEHDLFINIVINHNSLRSVFSAKRNNLHNSLCLSLFVVP